ncbi:unnamed protein product [Acanthoscelides obtectus]|uniref:Uncharacterized protein n=1 Tax=Acanthoscelides obtectus TaxID=200917 RepID=A0A9P0PPY2_ACAOB|nr:unnamed protein product [Acanthoscelides obtectus]CAK1633063.1 hypothetical protein AOBTE_LOCUS7916 [Acanthoscelides obtectus]
MGSNGYYKSRLLILRRRRPLAVSFRFDSLQYQDDFIRTLNCIKSDMNSTNFNLS